MFTRVIYAIRVISYVMFMMYKWYVYMYHPDVGWQVTISELVVYQGLTVELAKR